LLEGDKLPADLAEGERFLERARQLGDVEAIHALGYYAYQQKKYAIASEFFLQAFRAGISTAGINLTYMLRRGEVSEPSTVPPVEELLAVALSKNDVFAVVNHALCLAIGFQCERDWEAASRKIASIVAGDVQLPDVSQWWHSLGKTGDGEGHLVLGWLTRHNLVTDPDGLSSTQRFAIARAHTWDVPNWMDAPAG
jgi:hypothetical protein